MISIETATIETPMGELSLATRGRALCALEFSDQVDRFLPQLRRRFGVIDLQPGKNAVRIARRLEAYVAGDVQAIADLETDTAGTVFQERVWQALRQIPIGQTWSYQQLAEFVGRPKAVRAVGTANGANPVAIVNPCHRVIGADGALRGYAGGLERKRWLLDHEATHMPVGAPVG